MSEMLATLDGPAYIERVSVHDVKHIMKAKKAIKKAFQMPDGGQGLHPGGGALHLPHQLGHDAPGGAEVARGEHDPLLSPGRVKRRWSEHGSMQIIIAGFGGQGVLLIGQLLA